MKKLYHNPKCSKSRQTLALLNERGIEPEIILYLKDSPSSKEIKSLLEKLELSARELLRTGEEVYKTLQLNDNHLSDSALINAMAEHPILIERPILETDKAARIGRPPEQVLELI